MANSNTVSSSLPSRDYHCKVCDLYLDTVESLEVHLQYHKENLYLKWGSQNSQNDTENNNGKIKNETTVSAPADSSDNMITKPSPEFQQRATPETSGQFPHPATPQSYHSAPSPYQNPDQTNFSPGAQFGNSQFTHSGFQQNQHSEQLGWEQSQYNQEYHKSPRFHPYNMQDRVPQVTSSSPLYGQPLNQPTPSPSPNQCDKCGFVCESAVQLNEHCNTAHAGSNSTTTSATFQQFQPKYTTGFHNDNIKVKEESEETSDILDLDSQKVVYPGNEGDPQGTNYDQAQSQARDVNARAVPMIPWDTQKLYNSSQINGDSTLFKEQKMFSEQKPFPTDTKMFHPDQKFAYTQEKFLVHHDQKAFIHSDQKMYPGVHGQTIPPLADYPGAVGTNNPDMKPPYRPYDSPSTPQITSTQPANTTSSALPSIGGKGANWKSNEARRPKTYNCTACNKWFTSSGHLKRHYNTTLHKNAVRSSGQPDPATMPISSHHHPSRDALQARAAQQAAENNTQSPVPSEDGRSVDDAALQSPYPSQSFERPHRAATMQSKSPYSHLQQGNIDNNFLSNNPLANHPLPHQVGSHPLNIGSQPPGIGNPADANHQASKAISSTGNPPNGEAGPSVTQNHLRGLLSVSTNNITTPVLTQTTPQLTPHTLPPFSHLAVNPYSPRSTDPLVPSVPDPTHTPLYLGQNFQQTIAPNYPNGMAPHVMDMAINNLHIASPATFGEVIPEVAKPMDTQSPMGNASGPLPSFYQIQSQKFGSGVPNYLTSPNVGGQFSGDDATGGYIVLDSVNGSMQYNTIGLNSGQSEYIDYTNVPKYKQAMTNYTDVNNDKIHNYTYALGPKTLKDTDQGLHAESTAIQILKIEDIMDYANKENYESHMKSPASPESAKADNESGGSPSISSTVPSTPLVESNQLTKIVTEDVHKCYKCDKTFNKACYLTQHNKSFHSGEKPYKCERCGKRYPDGVSYERHLGKHEGVKPYKCPECPKSFNHKTDLRRHMCLHSGDKPYPCQHCGKGFIRKDHMMKHCETHKKKSKSN